MIASSLLDTLNGLYGILESVILLVGRRFCVEPDSPVFTASPSFGDLAVRRVAGGETYFQRVSELILGSLARISASLSCGRSSFDSFSAAFSLGEDTARGRGDCRFDTGGETK